MKQAILIHSHNFERDKTILEKYSTVREHEQYKQVRGYGHDGQWYLLIVEENNWAKICKRHKLNYFHTFSEHETRPFWIKVVKCSPFCYPQNKALIGKTMQVMIDPVNDQYYSIYPPLLIQKLCHSDGNYSRKGYIYGIHINDCIKTRTIKGKSISDEWIKFKKSLPEKAPDHLTLKYLNKLNGIVSKLVECNNV